MPHYVYLARCADGSLYCGTCIDLPGREAAHNAGKGAKFTRSRLPITFVYHESCTTRSEALKREHAIKRLPKARKELLVTARPAA